MLLDLSSGRGGSICVGLMFIYSCSQTVKTIDKYINMDSMNMNMNITPPPHPPHRLSVATKLVARLLQQV